MQSRIRREMQSRTILRLAMIVIIIVIFAPLSCWNFAVLAGGLEMVHTEMQTMLSDTVKLIAAQRKINHAASINVTDLFTSEFSAQHVYKFRDYLRSKFHPTRDADVFGNIEIVDIDDSDLRKDGDKFINGDFLRIVFRYSDDWSHIVISSAMLGNRRS